MGVIVPTMDEFLALSARVAVLEHDGPRPPDPQPGTGVQAKRIADLINLFGVNTFSSLNDGNMWGSWPADYRPESVIAALEHMTAGTGFAFRVREYHYEGREAMQGPWLKQIVAALPGTEVAICPGANATPACVPTMFVLANDPACGIKWVEGLNEPNTDFGSGEVPIATTQAIQDAVWQSRGNFSILGPSIVAGIPHPEGWITGYCGDSMGAINAAMHRGNGHYYPPGCPDLAGSGYSVAEYVHGLRIAYAEHPIDLTEFHPTLYNSEGNKPDQPGWSGARDAYYTLLTLLRCGAADVGLWWYALFDYGQSYICGLFPRCGTDEPRPAATAMRNLCRICADPYDQNRIFKPGRLAVSVEGLPPDGHSDLYQSSDGIFLLMLWRSAKDPGGAAVTVQVCFEQPASAVTVYDPLAGEQPVDGESPQVASLAVPLDCGVRIVAIAP